MRKPSPESSANLGKIEDEKNWLIFRDDDGKSYRIQASLLGRQLSLVGTVDPHNLDLLAGLKNKWITEDGVLTPAGKEELRLRREATDAARITVRSKFVQTLKQHGGEQNRIDVGNPVDRIEALMHKYGYDGDWRLTRVEGGDRYELLFFNKRGSKRRGRVQQQVDEGKVLSGPLKELLRKLDDYLGSLAKV